MSSNNNEQPSTLKAVADTITSGAQAVVGAITGDPADKRAADEKKAQAEREHEASKAGVSAGPLNVSASGVTVDNHDRRQGQYDQTMGSIKETAGNLLGNKDMVREGRTQNQQGQGQQAAGQTKDWMEGVKDRFEGTMGKSYAAAVGDNVKEVEYEKQHDQGKTTQRGVEDELRK